MRNNLGILNPQLRIFTKVLLLLFKFFITVIILNTKHLHFCFTISLNPVKVLPDGSVSLMDSILIEQQLLVAAITHQNYFLIQYSVYILLCSSQILKGETFHILFQYASMTSSISNMNRYRDKISSCPTPHVVLKSEKMKPQILTWCSLSLLRYEINLRLGYKQKY